MREKSLDLAHFLVVQLVLLPITFPASVCPCARLTEPAHASSARLHMLRPLSLSLRPSAPSGRPLRPPAQLRPRPAVTAAPSTHRPSATRAMAHTLSALLHTSYGAHQLDCASSSWCVSVHARILTRRPSPQWADAAHSLQTCYYSPLLRACTSRAHARARCTIHRPLPLPLNPMTVRFPATSLLGPRHRGLRMAGNRYDRGRLTSASFGSLPPYHGSPLPAPLQPRLSNRACAPVPPWETAFPFSCSPPADE